MRIRLGMMLFIGLIVILSAYVFAYATARKIYVIDNIFVTVVYYENYKSVYPLIELYYKNSPDNQISFPDNSKKDIFDLKDVNVLNINSGAREIEPADGWFFPFLFYPIEKFEIRYLIEKSGYKL